MEYGSMSLIIPVLDLAEFIRISGTLMSGRGISLDILMILLPALDLTL